MHPLTTRAQAQSVTAAPVRESLWNGALQHFATISLERRNKYEVTLTCVEQLTSFLENNEMKKMYADLAKFLRWSAAGIILFMIALPAVVSIGTNI